MSETTTPGAEAPAPTPVPAPAAPPETKAPEPETRAPFVILKPLIDGDRVFGAGTLAALTAAQAKRHEALVRAALPVDVSRWGRAVPEL